MIKWLQSLNSEFRRGWPKPSRTLPPAPAPVSSDAAAPLPLPAPAPRPNDMSQAMFGTTWAPTPEQLATGRYKQMEVWYGDELPPFSWTENKNKAPKHMTPKNIPLNTMRPPNFDVPAPPMPASVLYGYDIDILEFFVGQIRKCDRDPELRSSLDLLATHIALMRNKLAQKE